VAIRIDENKAFRGVGDDSLRFTPTDPSDQHGVSRREFLELASAGATARRVPTSFSAPQAGPECILGKLSTSANSQPQRDDMTLVVMKVEEGCGF
jgi:hypothetical protein